MPRNIRQQPLKRLGVESHISNWSLALASHRYGRGVSCDAAMAVLVRGSGLDLVLRHKSFRCISCGYLAILRERMVCLCVLNRSQSWVTYGDISRTKKASLLHRENTAMRKRLYDFANPGAR